MRRGGGVRVPEPCRRPTGLSVGMLRGEGRRPSSRGGITTRWTARSAGRQGLGRSWSRVAPPLRTRLTHYPFFTGRICEFHRSVILCCLFQLRGLAKLAPLPLRLMLRAVEPINHAPNAGKSQENCSTFGVWGSAPTKNRLVVRSLIVLVFCEAKAKR